MVGIVTGSGRLITRQTVVNLLGPIQSLVGNDPRRVVLGIPNVQISTITDATASNFLLMGQSPDTWLTWAKYGSLVTSEWFNMGGGAGPVYVFEVLLTS